MKKNYKMIRIKDLRIHENAIAKNRTNLSTYEIIMIKNSFISFASRFNSNIVRIEISLKQSRITETLNLFSYQALIDLDFIDSTTNINQDSLILLIKKFEKKEAFDSIDYDTLISSDIAESQTYNEAINSQYFNE